MEILIPRNWKQLKQYLRDPLYKNSFFIMLTSLSSSGFGFIFWMLAAKLYPKEDVGIATAMISSMFLIVLLSRFGLDQSIIRFFPENDKTRVFNTALTITTLGAILFGIIFILGIDFWSPNLGILKSKYALIYILFLAANSIVSITGASFVAMRKAVFYFIQSLVIGSRMIFLFLLVSFAAIGIFSAVGLSFLLAVIFALLVVSKLAVKPSMKVDKKFLKESFQFSSGNYIVGLFMLAPKQLLPIMVLNVLGTNKAAYYYISYAIASLLFMIPSAISTSLFVEGSHGEELKKTTVKALAAILLLLIPATILLYFTGGLLLSLIGKDYIEGVELLRFLVLTSFFVTVVSIYITIKRIQKNIKDLVFISGLTFILIPSLSYIFMIHFNLIGVGYAWIIGYAISSIIVGIMIRREKWF